ncbi:MAG: ABC transporter substrate-binding protein [Planctomycetota bacterium]
MSFRTVLAALSLGLPLLVGCSPDPYPGEHGKILHVSLRLMPKSFDPTEIEEEGSGKCAAHVYDGLLMYHPFARPYRLMPALAEAMPEVSEDRRTYTFRLRKGVRFQDDPCFPDGKGREVTAEDFVWCFKRFAHPVVNTPGWWLFDGWVEGLDAYRRQVDEERNALLAEGKDVPELYGIDRDVAGVRAVDRYTLQLRLTRPYPQFLWVLAMPYTSAYPKEAVAYYRDEFRNHPVGTGPFQVTEYNPVYRAVYRRNPTYREDYFPDPRDKPEERWEGWEEDEAEGLLVNAGKRMPLLDGMEIRFILEDQPRWLYFKAGYSDFLNPPKDNVAEAIPGGDLSDEMKARGTRLRPWPELGTVYSCLNCKDPVLANVELRRAMALAFDHKWTVDNLYAGQAIVATSLIPPGVAGFDPAYHPYHSEDGRPRIAEARRHLAAAGYPGGRDPATGRPLRITLSNAAGSKTAEDFGIRFRDEMKELGIEVDIARMTFPQLTEVMRKADFQVAGLAWGFDYPDAQNILQLLYGPNKAPGINRANFENAEFDRLYEQAAVMEDSPERTRLYVRMAHIVADEVPWITRTHRIRPNLQQPWLTGFKYTETSYQFWRYSDVDAEARGRLVLEWNKPVRWPLAVLGALFAAFLVWTLNQGRRP